MQTLIIQTFPYKVLYFGPSHTKSYISDLPIQSLKFWTFINVVQKTLYFGSSLHSDKIWLVLWCFYSRKVIIFSPLSLHVSLSRHPFPPPPPSFLYPLSDKRFHSLGEFLFNVFHVQRDGSFCLILAEWLLRSWDTRFPSPKLVMRKSISRMKMAVYCFIVSQATSNYI